MEASSRAARAASPGDCRKVRFRSPKPPARIAAAGISGPTQPTGVAIRMFMIARDLAAVDHQQLLEGELSPLKLLLDGDGHLHVVRPSRSPSRPQAVPRPRSQSEVKSVSISTKSWRIESPVRGVGISYFMLRFRVATEEALASFLPHVGRVVLDYLELRIRHPDQFLLDAVEHIFTQPQATADWASEGP